MQVGKLVKHCQEMFEKAGISTARLDCLVLLEDLTGQDRAWLLAHPEFELSERQVGELKKLLKRRAAHEPLAYLRGKTEFYGRTFIINEHVLEPRPESETMIDMLKNLNLFTLSAASTLHPRPLPEASSKAPRSGYANQTKADKNTRQTVRIADVGAGSGALGITAQLELPGVSVDLLEVDPQALQVAKTNVDLFTLNISVINSDLLTKSSKDYDILLCNLPYVPDDHTINAAALHEPKIAIFGGPDGLNLYRRLFYQAANCKKRPLYILTESLPPQHSRLADTAWEYGYQLTQTDDFIQLFADSSEKSPR